ncbi:MAG: hypothetical protein IPP88_17880 [Betaproteobacteria bacterium]|nr:hypothetical protein [Betaproteobacteria bacterium]
MTNNGAMMRSGVWVRDLRFAVAALAALLLAAMFTGQAIATEVPNTPGRIPRPVIEKADGTACVADPAFMRKNHMDLLKHQRDDTMHHGIRTPRFSLVGCINCHASKKTNSVVAGADNFCQSCHAYAGVTLDCFECHSATPGAASRGSQPASTPASSATAANGGKQ